MTPISVEALLSALSLQFTILAYVCTTSQLDERIENGDCIGLMARPPILCHVHYESELGQKYFNVTDNDTILDTFNDGRMTADD